MNKTLIVGGGFAIYGYLPAIMETTTGYVYLGQRNFKRLKQRSELHQYLERVVLFDGEVDYNEFDSLVVALPPLLQSTFIRENLPKFSEPNLFLEKPISNTPSDSDYLLDLALKVTRKIKVGYLFIYTDWFKKLENIINEPPMFSDCISINWQFYANHWSTNTIGWKMLDSNGGGAIRFYAIHLIAVAAKLGFNNIKKCYCTKENTGMTKSIHFELSDKNKRNLKFNLDTKSQVNSFVVKHKNNVIADLTGPFDEPNIIRFKDQDKRCGFIARHISSDVSTSNIAWLRATNQLWSQLENSV